MSHDLSGTVRTFRAIFSQTKHRSFRTSVENELADVLSRLMRVAMTPSSVSAANSVSRCIDSAHSSNSVHLVSCLPVSRHVITHSHVSILHRTTPTFPPVGEGCRGVIVTIYHAGYLCGAERG